VQCLTPGATDIAQALKDAFRENRRLENSDVGAMLIWALNRDNRPTEPTADPAIWSRFRCVADTLVRTGHELIYCSECRAAIEPVVSAAF